jgi:twinkle protein
VIVEGEMDKLAIDAVQGPATVSVPDGAPAIDARDYTSKFAYLSGVAEERLRSAKRVLIATDMDAPGERLADELARRIGYTNCARVQWPEGCKDANETLVKRGATALCDALMDAKPYPIEGLIAVRDLREPVERLYQHGLDRGVTSGWTPFDTHYRARAGLMAVVTGSPGSGKSHFLDNLMVRLARQHDWTFGICSPENQPLERHVAGLIAVWQGKPFTDGPLPRMSLGEVRGTDVDGSAFRLHPARRANGRSHSRACRDPGLPHGHPRAGHRSLERTRTQPAGAHE